MKAIVPATVRNVLAISVQGIGNTLLALPALAKLKAAAPRARLTLLVSGDESARLFSLAAPVDECLALPARRSLPRLLLLLRKRRFDLALVTFPHGNASALLALASGARHRAGHDSGRIARSVFHTAAQVDRTLHDVSQNCALVTALGLDTEAELPVGFRLPDERAGHLGWLPAEKTYAVIHPGCDARFPEKRWDAGRFGRVAAELSRQAALTTIVLHGPGERPLAQRVVDESEGAACLAPSSLDLVDAALVIKGARLFLGNDSGPMNLAILLGVSTTAVFGPSESSRTAPRGPRARCVRSGVDCSPCWGLSSWEGCPQGRVRCMDEVTVEQVTHAALDLLSESGEGPA